MILEDRLKAIGQLLSLFALQVRTDVSMGFLDKNRVAEDILIPVFAEVYGYPNLKNLNDDGENFPSIDLGDETAKVAIQVSSEVDSAKVRDTLTKFQKYRHYEKFEHLIVYDLIDKQGSYAGTGWDKIIDGKFRFSKDDDIRDHTDLAAAIRRLPLEKVGKVQDILEKHLGKFGDISIAVPDHSGSLHQLRPTLTDFKGRQGEIRMIKKNVANGGRNFVLHGMGGVGKTELALAVANELVPEFPDAQLFINLQNAEGEPRSLTDILKECIQAFPHPVSGPEDSRTEDQLVSHYHSLLHGKKLLVLFDNAESRDQVARLLPGHESAVIITARSPIVVPGMVAVPVEALAPEEAVDLMLAICPRLERGQAAEISDMCGHLPLAVRAAASLLAVVADLDADTYSSELRDERTRIEKIGAEGVDIGVAAAFNLSYSKLSDETARVFRSISVFRGSFTAEAETYVAHDPEHKGLSDLLRRSLVIFDPTSKRYIMHTLVRLFAVQHDQPDERRKANARFAAYFFEVLTKANSYYLGNGGDQTTGIQLFEDDRPNIVEGFQIRRAIVEANPNRLEVTWRYLVLGSQILMDRLRPEEAIEWAEHVRAIAQAIENESAELGPLTVLGLSHHRLGKLTDAIPYFARSVEIADRVGDTETLAHSLDYLGRVYMEMGHPHRAIDHFKQSKDIFHLIGRHFEEGRPMTDLALSYAQVGDTNAAIYYLDQVVSEARDHGKRFEEANGLANLSRVWKMRSQEKTAELAEQAAKIYNEIGFPYWQAKALSQAGFANVVIGNVDMGLEQLGESVKIHEQVGDPFGLSLALGSHGDAMAQLGRLDDALAWYDKQLELGRDINSLEAQANALGSKSVVFRKQGDLANAETNALAALEIDRQSGNRENEFITMCHLGECYLDLGDLGKALGTFQDQLELTKRQGLAKNVLHSYDHVAKTLFRRGDLDAVHRTLTESIEWCKTTSDPHDHPASLFQSAKLLAAMGEQESAVAAATESAKLFRSIDDTPCASEAEQFIKNL